MIFAFVITTHLGYLYGLHIVIDTGLIKFVSPTTKVQTNTREIKFVWFYL